MEDDNIVVKPLIFIKGKTKICLYGIGHMKDKDLNEKYKLNKLKFERPEEDGYKCFNILVLH